MKQNLVYYTKNLALKSKKTLIKLILATIIK
ncbi:hypothetical protein CUP0042 [Campylobacter upsaliensis RM3195]|nr:hypothetical protein CUP0042 [Campylobacter upsaliensis RM3195]